MTTNQDRATQIINAKLIESCYPEDIAQALADAGLLASTPVPLEPGDRNFVIDHLMENRQRANILGSTGMTEAWEAAANAFADTTQENS